MSRKKNARSAKNRKKSIFEKKQEDNKQTPNLPPDVREVQDEANILPENVLETMNWLWYNYKTMSTI